MEGPPAAQNPGFGQGGPVLIGFALLFLIVLLIAITACCQKYLGTLRRRWKLLKSQLRAPIRVEIEPFDALGTLIFSTTHVLPPFHNFTSNKQLAAPMLYLYTVLEGNVLIRSTSKSMYKNT